MLHLDDDASEGEDPRALGQANTCWSLNKVSWYVR